MDKLSLKELWKGVPMWTKCVLISVFIITVGLSVGCTSWWKNYPQDNIVEEFIEELIEEKTDIQIDLSPFSPEGEKRWPQKYTFSTNSISKNVKLLEARF